MLGVGSVLLVASLYLALLFTIASRGEGRANTGPRPLRYTLALAGGLRVPEANGTDTFMLALPIATDNTLATASAQIESLKACRCIA